MKPRNSILRLFFASTMLCGLAAGAVAEELVTDDHVGKADAPMLVRAPGMYSRVMNSRKAR